MTAGTTTVAAAPARAHGARSRALSRMIAWRLAGTVVTLLVISILAFLMTYIGPGNTIRNLTGLHPTGPAAIAALKHEYGLDRSLPAQYLSWLGNFLHGDWGRSIMNGAPVSQVFAERVWLTVLLCALSFVIAVIISIPLGVLAAVSVGQINDRLVSMFTIVGLSAPPFAVGLLLLYLFTYVWPLFPGTGGGSGLFDELYHLVLPAVAMMVGVSAYIVRITRVTMIRELDSDYVSFLRARGVGQRRILWVALRNAAIPIVTVAGLVLPYVVGATILVETTFTLPGLGGLLQDSVQFKDYPVVQFLVLFVATVIAVGTLGVDLLCLALNPEWRREAAR